MTSFANSPPRHQYPDPKDVDPLLFDLFGQVAFGDLEADPFQLQLQELQLPPIVSQRWSQFTNTCHQAALKAGDGIPGEVIRQHPVVQDPETQRMWEELVQVPTIDTWRTLLDGSHPSQSQRSQKSAATAAVSGSSKQALPGSGPSTSSRPRAQAFKGTGTEVPSQTDLDEFFVRSAPGRATRNRSLPSRYSGYDTSDNETRAAPKKQAAQTKKGKRKASEPLPPPAQKKPKKKVSMSSLERREQTAAMRGRAPESPASEESAQTPKKRNVVEEDEDDFDDFEDDEDDAYVSPVPRRVTQSKRPPARTSTKGRKSRQDEDLDAVDVDDISDVEEVEDEDGVKPAKGIGSKGSKYIQYFIPKLPIEHEWKYVRRSGTKTKIKITVQYFDCHFCNKPVRVIHDRPSALALHFNEGVKGSLCKHKYDPKDKTLRGTFGPWVPIIKPKPTGGNASTAAPSVIGGNNSVVGWIDGARRRNLKEQIAIIRRLTIIWLISDSLPFTTLRSPKFIDLMKAVNPDTLDAFKSARQVGRDITRFSSALLDQALHTLRQHSFGIQVDEWTTPGMQHAFQATVVSFIADDWTFKSFCIDFQVLRGRHSGATFSGMLVDLLVEHNLLDQWNGSLTSDSASSNVRMAALLEERMEEDHPDVAFDARRDHVRCFAHHLNLVVQSLFIALGVPKAASKRKIISSDGTGLSDPGPDLEDPKRLAKLVAPLESDAEDEEDDESWDDFDDDDDDPGADDDNEDLKNKAARNARTSNAAASGVGPGEEDLPEFFVEGDAERVEADALADDLDLNAVLETIPELDEEVEEEMPASTSGTQGPVTSGANSTSQPTATESQESTSTVDPTTPTSAQPITPPFFSPLLKVSEIVTIARSSPERRRLFLRAAQQAYINAKNEKKAKAVRLPPAYNKTRWNSRFFQLRVALRFAKALTFVVRSDLLEEKPTFGARLDIKADEIALLRRTTNILGYFLVLTKEVEARAPTAADILRLHGDLKYALEVEIAAAKRIPGPAGAFFASALQAAADKLRPYRENAIKCRPLLLAALFDPKHRLSAIKRDYPDKVEAAKKALNEEVAKVVGSSEAPKMPTTPKSRSVTVAMYSRSPAVEEAVEQDEVTAYLGNRFPMRDHESVLGWWKDNEVNFPILAKVARRALASSGSTAEVERVFSAAGRFCTVRRRRLTPDSLRRLVVAQQLLNAGFDPVGSSPIPATPLITPA
ncbi:hypothetical protein CF319_g7166 [Tilletia indica]|nr:hypothetical protein CF319_g7166 [Tilletia indica]